MAERINGLDVARALAIFGMVIVNFKVAMEATEGSQILLTFTSLFEGRASALFVLLAGIGIALGAEKARLSTDLTLRAKTRNKIIKRGVLLIVIGLLYLPIWPADILHFYGFYFVIAAFLFHLSSKQLLWIAAAVIVSFPLLMLVFNYDAGWNWETFEYVQLWTIDGMIRRILFNGFHPVIPWIAFLLLGMSLARMALNNPKTRIRLLKISSITWLSVEAVLIVARILTDNGASIGLSPDEAGAMLSSSIIPPLPHYMVSASASAVMVLVVCLMLADRFSKTPWIRWLKQTGQLSLTLYAAHVIIGMGILEELGMLPEPNIMWALISAVIFSILGVLFSVLWLKRWRQGPLEWCFRKLI